MSARNRSLTPAAPEADHVAGVEHRVDRKNTSRVDLPGSWERRRLVGDWEPRLPGNGPRRLLVVEDSRDYAALIEQMLRESLDPGIVVVHGDTLSHALSLLTDESSIDGVLLDLALPDAMGLEALEAVQAVAPETPVVVLTGKDDEALAVRAVQEGAQDFLPKRGTDAALLA